MFLFIEIESISVTDNVEMSVPALAVEHCIGRKEIHETRDSV